MSETKCGCQNGYKERPVKFTKKRKFLSFLCIPIFVIHSDKEEFTKCEKCKTLM